MMEVEQTVYECEICLKKFGRKRNLTKHYEVHLEKYLACDYCEKKFKTKQGLHRHKQNIHLTALVTCEYCGNVVKNKISLQVHQRDNCPVVSKVRFFCDFCGVGFLTKFLLRFHLKNHDRELFKCTKCQYSCFSPSGLSRHIANFHIKTTVTTPQPPKQDLSPFMTRLEERNKETIKFFAWRSEALTYRDSWEIFEGKSSFECSQCSQVFSSRFSLEVHLMELGLCYEKDRETAFNWFRTYEEDNDMQEKLKSFWNSANALQSVETEVVESIAKDLEKSFPDNSTTSTPIESLKKSENIPNIMQIMEPNTSIQKDPVKNVKNYHVTTLPATRGAKRRAPVTSVQSSKIIKAVKTHSNKDPDSRHRSLRSSLNKSESRHQGTAYKQAVNEEEEANSDASWNSEDDPDRLWCICKQPHNNRFMICCDKCEEWFHGTCVNVTEVQAKVFEGGNKKWLCPNCKSEGVAKPDPNKKNLNQQKLTKHFSKNQVESTDEEPPKTSLCVICNINSTRPDSIYCSDECIQNHATIHIDDASPKTPTSQNFQKAEVKRTAIFINKKGYVRVYDRMTKKILSQELWPHINKFQQWLQKNPNCEPVGPGSNKANVLKSSAWNQKQLLTSLQKSTISSTAAPIKSQQKICDASVNVRHDWALIKDMDFPRLQKLSLPGIEDGDDIARYGALEFYDESYDRVNIKNERPLEKFDRICDKVTTSDDPIIQGISGTRGNVFATDWILATLMCCTRSNYSWDIVIEKIGDKLFMDKRDNTEFDLLTVNETAVEPPQDDGNALNSPSKLALEATFINHNFSQQVLKTGDKFKFENPHPFLCDDEEDQGEVASIGYRYRSWSLKDGIELVARCEHDAVMIAPTGDTQFISIKALNEWDSKVANGVDWRQKLDIQRGAVLANELRNNACKLAKWTVQALLAGSDQIKFGYVSRAHVRDASKHVILGTQQFKPHEFATQINFSMDNAWGILRCIIDICMKQKDGKYLIMKDPNKSLIRLYNIPDSTSDLDSL